MNNNLKYSRLLTSVASLALCLAAGSLHAGSKTGLNTFDFGNSQAGAKGSYKITTANSSGTASVDMEATGTVKFLAKSVKGVEFTTSVKNVKGKKSANFSLKVAGYTVDSGTKSASYTWIKEANRTLVTASLTTMVGPVPVTISGSVGGGASISCTLELSTTGGGVSGNASSWANGSASAGVGVTLLQLALQSDLTLGKTSLNPSLSVTPSKMSGQATLNFDAVKIDLAVVLKTLKQEWYRSNLASYYSGN